MLGLSYGAGLRVSETVNLKVQDINLGELTLLIKQSKGQKDRISLIPEKLVDNLRNLIAGKDVVDFVFASERGGKLTTRTAQKVFESSLKKSGVQKTGNVSQPAAQLCHPPTGKWRGCKICARIARS